MPKRPPHHTDDYYKKARLKDLIAENKRLKDVLDEYGKHHKTCKIIMHGNEYLCTCGFKQALERTGE